jgi:hypothetical protein
MLKRRRDLLDLLRCLSCWSSAAGLGGKWSADVIPCLLGPLIDAVPLAVEEAKDTSASCRASCSLLLAMVGLLILFDRG